MEIGKAYPLTTAQCPTTLNLHYTADRYLKVQLGSQLLNRVKNVNVETLSDGSHNVQITLNIRNVIFTSDDVGSDSN